ncbi:YnfA family protein [Bacillus pseudomycoides]|uniref:YnfA family protein n=1 Tax=Bacillus pseudomycoides TaxID=64104 RepID=UPI003D1B83CB
MFKAAVIFILAGLAEIGGGYLIWKWIREGGSIWFGLMGGIILCLYGVIATFQVFSSFGRVYAAYGGVFILMSLFWGWMVDKKTPDLFDWAGAAVCLVGVFIILWPRG